MPWHDDILVNLPPPSPHGGEPAELRRDILDELADHLDCAVRREMKKTDDESEARRAAAARFGDPTQIARRLWLDAMKEQLMSRRMMMGTQIVLAAMVIVLGVVVFVQFQSQRAQQAMLMELRVMSEHARAQALEAEARARVDREATVAGATLDWPQFTVHIRAPDDKSGVQGLKVHLVGEVYNVGKPKRLTAVTDSDGRADFGRIRAGGYELSGHGKDGTWFKRDVVAAPGPSQPLAIRWIDVQHKLVPTALQIKLPEQVDYRWLVAVLLRSRPLVGDGRPEIWEAPSLYLLFDERGRVASYEAGSMDVSGQLSSADIESLDWSDRVALDVAMRYTIIDGNLLMGQDDIENPTVFTDMRRFTSGRPKSFEAATGSTGAIELQPDIETGQSLASFIEQRLQMQKLNRDAAKRRGASTQPAAAKDQ